MFVTVRPGISTEETSGKDLKFVLIEKENAPTKKETERLVTTKDTGKMFMSAAPASTPGSIIPSIVSFWCNMKHVLVDNMYV